MNTQIIYDVANEPPITPFSIPVIIICLLSIIFIVYLIKTWKNSDSVVGNIILLVVAVFVLSITVTTHSVNFFKVKKILSDYEKGNCEVVEGQIENYEQFYKVGTMAEEDYPDRFFVGDTEFIVYGYSTYGVENFWRQSDGSELQEGQDVRITYVNCFHENLILKVELMEEPPQISSTANDVI